MHWQADTTGGGEVRRISALSSALLTLSMLLLSLAQQLNNMWACRHYESW